MRKVYKKMSASVSGRELVQSVIFIYLENEYEPEYGCLTEQSVLIDVLMDGLLCAEFVTEVEKIFGIEITDVESEELEYQTLGTLVDFVCERQG